jgi:hypothetical protein
VAVTPQVQRFFAEQRLEQDIIPRMRREAIDWQLAVGLDPAAAEAAAEADLRQDRENLIAQAIRPVTDQEWETIIKQIETPGSWNNIGGDITPPLAALVFGLTINVINDHGQPYPVGDGPHHIVMVRTNNSHYDATITDHNPATITDHNPHDESDGWSDGYGSGGDTYVLNADTSTSMTSGLPQVIDQLQQHINRLESSNTRDAAALARDRRYLDTGRDLHRNRIAR